MSTSGPVHHARLRHEIVKGGLFLREEGGDVINDVEEAEDGARDLASPRLAARQLRAVGTGSYCPTCFERVRSDGTLPTVAKKTRDYGAMARVSVVVGLFFTFAFVGPLFGILSLYYQAKARKQRREMGEDPWSAGMVVVMLLAILEIVGGGLMIAFLLWGLFRSK